MSGLSKALLNFDAAHPGDADAEVIVPGRTWAKWMELARLDEKKPAMRQCANPGVHPANCTCAGERAERSR